MDQDPIVKRIIELMDKNGMKPSQFAKEINFNQSNLSKILRGERSVPANLIEAILTHTSTTREWLLGLNDVTEQSQAEKGTLVSTNKHGVSYWRVGDKLMARVPLMKFNAYGSNPDEWGDITADRDDVDTIMVEVDRVSRGKYVVFSVDNDSMDDGTRKSFEAGDKIFTRELERQDWSPRLHFETWPYWVVAFGNCIRLKQIIGQDDRGNITLHSLNPSPEFTDFTLQLDEVSHLYNVIRKIPKTVDYGN